VPPAAGWATLLGPADQPPPAWWTSPTVAPNRCYSRYPWAGFVCSPSDARLIYAGCPPACVAPPEAGPAFFTFLRAVPQPRASYPLSGSAHGAGAVTVRRLTPSQRSVT